MRGPQLLNLDHRPPGRSKERFCPRACRGSMALLTSRSRTSSSPRNLIHLGCPCSIQLHFLSTHPCKKQTQAFVCVAHIIKFGGVLFGHISNLRPYNTLLSSSPICLSSTFSQRQNFLTLLCTTVEALCRLPLWAHLTFQSSAKTSYYRTHPLPTEIVGDIWTFLSFPFPSLTSLS